MAPFIEQNSNWRILLLNLGNVTLWKPRDATMVEICVSPGVPIQDSQSWGQTKAGADSFSRVLQSKFRLLI
jgi:hypothetical protein